MQADLSTSLLGLFVPLILALALWAPPHWLLFADLLLVLFPGEWYVGLHFDASDLVLAGLVLAFARGRAGLRPRGGIPYFAAWLSLGIILSLAYVSAPINEGYLTSPVAVVYQVYRYCWRPILFYPLAVLLLADRNKLETGLMVIVLAADLCTLLAVSQGYAGDEAKGPFASKNLFGGALVMPVVIALSGLLYTQSRWGWRFYVVSLLLMARGLLFAGSRGAIVAVAASTAFFLTWLLVNSRERTKALRFALAVAILGLAVIALKPDVFERPTVQGLLTASRGMEDDNMQWRMQERWPHFWQMALDNFWLGTGSDVDRSLAECPTPHNGYLGIAVTSGIPSLVLIVTLALLGMRNGILRFRQSGDPWLGGLGITITAAILGLLIHNMVDQTIGLAFAAKTFWMLTALATMVVRRPAAFAPLGTVAGAPADGARQDSRVQLTVVGARQ